MTVVVSLIHRSQKEISIWAVKVWSMSMWRVKPYWTCVKGLVSFFSWLGWWEAAHTVFHKWPTCFLQSPALPQIPGCGISPGRARFDNVNLWVRLQQHVVDSGARRKGQCPTSPTELFHWLTRPLPDKNWHVVMLWQWETYPKAQGCLCLGVTLFSPADGGTGWDS